MAFNFESPGVRIRRDGTPTVGGHECLLFTCTTNGDPNNADSITGNIPEWQLVPHDNNIAQRNLVPVPGARIDGLQDTFGGKLRFYVRNPYEFDIVVTLKAQLPNLLVTRGWSLTFSPGPKLNLDARDPQQPYPALEVRMNLLQGQNFTRAELLRLKETDRDINIFMHTEQGIIGGMSYRLDPDMAEYIDTTGDD